MGMSALGSVRLLGEPQVVRGGEVAPGPRGRKAWGLLAYLLRSELPPSRQRVAALLFPEAEDPLATLRWTLVDARRLLGDEADVGGDPLRLELPATTFVDVAVLTDGGWSEAIQLPNLGRELLEGSSFASAPAFELWLEGERRHLRRQSAAVLHEAGLASLAAGDVEQAVDHARRLVGVDPYDENHHVLLVRALSRAGDVPAAEEAARAASELLREQLGIEPTASLVTAAKPPAEETFVATAAAVTARMEAGEAAIEAGSWQNGLELLRQAASIGDRVADVRLRAHALVTLGSALVHAARGLDEEGAAALHQGARFAKRTGEPLLATKAMRELAYVEFLRARYGQARRWLVEAAELNPDDPGELAWIRLIEGACATDLADYAAAESALDEAIAVADDASLPHEGAFARSFLGRWHLLRDELAAAETCLSTSMRQAREAGWTAFVPWPEALLGEVQLRQGDLDAAAVTFEHAYTMGRELGDVCWESMGMRGLGLVAIERRDIDEGVRLLEQAPRRCVQLPDSYLWIVPYGLDALCSVGVSQGLPSTGRWVGELERAADEGGLRELSARALLHRARLGEEGAFEAAGALTAGIDNPALHGELDQLAG